MLAVLVWWTVVAGVLVRLLPRASLPRESVVAGVLLAALAGLTVVSIAWASDNGGAFDEGVRAMGYVGVFALVVLASPEGSGRGWLTGLAIGLTVVSVLALASRMLPDLFPDQGVVAALPETAGRLSYPLGYWNGLGALLALGGVLLIALAGLARSRMGRAAATAAIPLPALAVFLTSSRGASIALAVGLVLLFAFGRNRPQMAVATAIGAAAGGLLVLASVDRDLFIDGRTGAVGFDTEAHEMLLLTLVVVAAALTLRALLDPLVERVKVPRQVAVGVSIAAAIVLAGALLAVDPMERLDQLKAPPTTQEGPGARGLTTSHLTSTEGTGRYQFWHAGLDCLQERPDRRDRGGGLRALVGAARFARLLRAQRALALHRGRGRVGGGGAAASARLPRGGGSRGSAHAKVPGRGGGGPGGRRPRRARGGAGRGRRGVDLEIPGAFVPVIVVAGVLAGPALSHGRPALVRVGAGSYGRRRGGGRGLRGGGHD